MGLNILKKIAKKFLEMLGLLLELLLELLLLLLYAFTNAFLLLSSNKCTAHRVAQAIGLASLV